MKKVLTAILVLAILLMACACTSTKMPEGWEVAEYVPLAIKMAWPVEGLASGDVRGYGDGSYFLLCFDGCSAGKDLVSRGRGQESSMLFAYMHNDEFSDMGAPCGGFICADKIEGTWEAGISQRDLFINGKYYKSITYENFDYKQTTILVERDGLSFELTANGTHESYEQMFSYAKLIAATMQQAPAEGTEGE